MKNITCSIRNFVGAKLICEEPYFLSIESSGYVVDKISLYIASCKIYMRCGVFKWATPSKFLGKIDL